MILTAFDPSTVDWANIEAMLLELMSSGFTWFLGAAMTLGPVLIGWFVRKVMDKLTGANQSIATINNTVAGNSELVKQLEQQQIQTQKLLVALITMSNLSVDKKEQMLALVQKADVDIAGMITQAKETVALDSAAQKAVEQATSLLADLAAKAGV